MVVFANRSAQGEDSRRLVKAKGLLNQVSVSFASLLLLRFLLQADCFLLLGLY